MHISGESPGKGRYLCTKCSRGLYLEDGFDKLPLCPGCYNHEFIAG